MFSVCDWNLSLFRWAEYLWPSQEWGEDREVAAGNILFTLSPHRSQDSVSGITSSLCLQHQIHYAVTTSHKIVVRNVDVFLSSVKQGSYFHMWGFSFFCWVPLSPCGVTQAMPSTALLLDSFSKRILPLLLKGYLLFFPQPEGAGEGYETWLVRYAVLLRKPALAEALWALCIRHTHAYLACPVTYA